MILLEFNVERWYHRRQPETTSQKDRCLKMIHTRIWQGKQHDRRPKLGSIEPIGFSTHAQQHNQAKIKVTTSKQVANDAPKVPAW